MFDIVAIVLVLTAAFSYFNHRFLRLPMTIGVMAIALVMSLALSGLDEIGFKTLLGRERALIGSIDFTEILMQEMLSLMLFAGALHVDLKQLRRAAWPVGALAVIGTTLSAVIIGIGTWYLLGWLDLAIPLIHCLVFGALISPTDPIAVLSMLKSANVPTNIEVTIAGESLFNDGVGVVLFAALLLTLSTGTAPTFGAFGLYFAQQALGGGVFGVAVGYLVYRILRTIDEPQVEILITLATVVGGYALAHAIGVSGPLAMVAIGLIIGNQGRRFGMSRQTRELLDGFWRTIDTILNAVLFVLIGLQFAVIAAPPGSIVASSLVVVLCVLARYLVVGLPMRLVPSWFGMPARAGLLITWGGLRGGISVALALSLPAGPERGLILMLTYSVVVFSILVQGLTVGRLARSLALRAREDSA